MSIEKKVIESEAAMKAFGADLGAHLKKAAVIQLVGDIGAGKTTLVKGIAEGMKVNEPVQSPSFTISRVYDAEDGLRLAHYDFYRLNEPGIMANELQEDTEDAKTVTIIEWADIVEGVLPEPHVAISITAPTETTRELTINDPSGVLA
jgi:tRNA threonylcarbamoyladenosine biosynthesis protein TsaE